MIVQSHEPIVLVGAGLVSAGDMDLVRAHASRVVAADGGAAHCLAAGIVPDAVIGDLDSLDDALRDRIPADRLHIVSEQETTDFEKCLRSVDAPLLLAVGFSGPRIDHLLAVCNALVRHPTTRVIVASDADLIFHAPRRIALEMSPGDRLSLFPMAAVTGRSEGLRWPIEGLAFDPLRRIGTSNEVTGRVRLEFDGPGMLVITPRAALGAVMRALSA